MASGLEQHQDATAKAVLIVADKFHQIRIDKFGVAAAKAEREWASIVPIPENTLYFISKEPAKYSYKQWFSLSSGTLISGFGRHLARHLVVDLELIQDDFNVSQANALPKCDQPATTDTNNDSQTSHPSATQANTQSESGGVILVERQVKELLELDDAQFIKKFPGSFELYDRESLIQLTTRLHNVSRAQLEQVYNRGYANGSMR